MQRAGTGETLTALCLLSFCTVFKSSKGSECDRIVTLFSRLLSCFTVISDQVLSHRHFMILTVWLFASSVAVLYVDAETSCKGLHCSCPPSARKSCCWGVIFWGSRDKPQPLPRLPYRPALFNIVNGSVYVGFNNETGTVNGEHIIPNIVHFLFFEESRISYVTAVCVLAVFKEQNPQKISLHTDIDQFSGPHWEKMKNTAGLSYLLTYCMEQSPA